MRQSIVIIGAGMGGLAAGIYGQRNGYRTQIFEAHAVAGGQCASWKRKGYTFDGCIHHLFGCDPKFRLFNLWRELGAMPRALAPTAECAAALSPEGKLFRDYYQPEQLEAHLRELAPADGAVIADYLAGIRAFAASDFYGDLMLGGAGGAITTLPQLLARFRWLKPTMQSYGARFSDPFLKQAFPLMEYSLPELPFMLHLVKHAYGWRRGIAWPMGGAKAFAQSIADHYLSLGGELHLGAKVTEILTENRRAVGVRLADGSEHRADIVISNADGRKTILELLGGRYLNDRIRGYCGPATDETNWALHVFLGVNRDLSREPSSLVLLLPESVRIADHATRHLEMQMYGMDSSMAPAGKGVIKVELVSSYSHWKRLYDQGQQAYAEEKQKAAEQVIGLLERQYFKGITSQVEAVDVPTLLTWERYMGGTHGFANAPNKKFSVGSLLGLGQEFTLPGLENFYLVGVWATMAGALFANAISGRKVVRQICRKDGKRFEPV